MGVIVTVGVAPAGSGQLTGTSACALTGTGIISAIKAMVIIRVIAVAFAIFLDKFISLLSFILLKLAKSFTKIRYVLRTPFKLYS